MEITMDYTWLKILSYIFCVLIGGLVTYFKTSPKAAYKANEAIKWIERIRGMAAKYIDRAEGIYKETNRGGDKFNWVVNTLHDQIPAAIKPFISKEAVADIVQEIFDNIESYAGKQLDKLADKIDLEREW